MSIEDPRLSSIDNTSAADEFDSAVEQHLGFASETVEGIEVAQAETPDAGRTDRLPAQQPVDVAAAVIPSEVTPDNENVVTLPAGVELDNLEFQVEGENLVLVLADGTEITVIGGAANIPTFVIGDVELPQVALFAALEESNINVAAGPDGTFSAQSTPAASRNFNDDPINAGPEDFALADLLGDTSFGDELRTAQIFGGNGRPSIPTPLTTSFIYDEAVIAGGDGVKIISGRLPFNPGPDSGTITAIGFVGASDVDEGDGLKVLAGFTSGGLPISVTSFAPVGPGLSFLAAEGRDSAGNLVFTITVTNRVTGDFTFELVGKLEHPDAGSNGSQDDLDDLLRLGFTYTVTDRDGDSVTGTFNIDVQDDAPTIGAPVGGSVNEDDLTGKVEEPKLVKRISDSESDSDMPLSNTSKAEGSLAIRWGADNDLKSETLNEDNQPTGDDPVGRTVSFTGLDTSSTSEEIQAAIPGLAGLSSDGFRLAYRIEYTTGADGKWNGGYQLVAFKAFDGPLKPLFIEGEGDAFLDFPYRGEGETIFIITLNPTTANGSYTFELIGNLDHYVAGGSGSVPSETDVSARVFGPETPREAVDFLDFEIPFTATDSDGDSADGKFTVRVEDDEPVIVGRPIAHTVDEDDISTIGRDIPGESLGTSPNDGNRDGSFTGDRGANNPGPATVSGSFAGMVDFGADNRFTTYSIIDEDAARAALTRLGLTSKGGVLSFDLIGDTLYAFVNAGEPGVVYNAGPDRLVFTLTVEANGEYAFKLFDQLDHDLGKGQNTDLQDKIEGDVRDIDFGQIIKASDFDGDSVSLEGYFSVTIRDDVPELVRGASEDRTVDEDDISTIGDRFPGESLGTSPNDGNADGSFTGSQGNNQPGPAFIAGSLASLVKSGADESLTFSFINGDVARGMLESLGLSSKGAELSYEIRNGVLYAFDNAGSELGKSYDPQFGDRLVFELKLNGNGSYEFRLYDQLDHDAPGDDFWERPTNSDENFDLQDGLWFKDVTAINFGALIKATDYDGDSVSLNNAFSIKIRDDVPELSGKEENRLVDEDDIKNDQSTGNFPNDGSGDGSFTGNQNNNGNGPANISGSLAKLIKGGADDTVEFSFIREDAARAALEKLGLKSEGAELSYDIRDGVLYAFDNAGPQKGESYDPDNGDRLVFKLTLSKDGSYTFELLDQLDHDLGGGQNTDLQNGPRVNEVEAIDFGSIIKATDYDGDSVVLKDAFSITIKDDAPVLSGRKENRIVDEDDISTLNDGLIGGSLGTSPNDDDEDDDSFTGSPNNNQPGPAFISGSLANLVRGGADDPIKFSFIDEATVIRTLENLGLSSKGEELSYDIQGNVLYGFDNDKGSNSYGTGDRPVFKLTLSEDGSYTFELLDQLDHDKPASGVNENYDLQDDIAGDVTAINFGALIKATDYDGDSVSLDGAFSITIRDDVPTAFARNTNETLVVDESDKRQNDDVTGPLNVFKFVGTKGEDPNMSAQFAQQSNFVAADINGGADDDVKIEWDLKINGGNGTPSGLFTTDGRSIVLFLENGLIVGRYDSPNDGNTNITSSDPAAFALHLSDNGTLSMVQYVSIRHDDPSDHDENDDANDGNPSTALQTLAGKVNAVLTVTDYDGDKAVSEVAVGDRIQFQDDGPVANFSGTVIVTEDGTTAGSFLTQSATGTLSFDAGADGAKVTSIAYRFGSTILEMSEGNSDPQSFPALTSGGQPVVVTTSTDGLTVTGTVTVDGVAKPVFTLVVTNAQTGAYTFTQTAPIDHPDRNEAGQSDSLRMVFDFTVTDGDGDTSSSSIQIDILDDAPTLVSTPTTGLSLNEDDLIPGNDETAPKEPLSVTGNLNISLGADGGSIALSAPAAEWSATNKTLTATDGSWKVTLNSDGTYKFDLLNKTLAHGFGDNGQNTLSIDVTYTATDGDQDVLTGSFTIEIVDDVPVAVGESATVREAVPGVGGNLILAFDVSGSMSDPVNGGGSASRISVAKQAAINLINASDAAMIMIVTFAGNAQASQWLSKADALAFIQGNGFPSPAGGTEYDDAVEAIMDANAGANLTGTNTSLYFFSDGRVSDEDDLSNQELRAWENFLRDNDIDSYAVGVGSNVSENDSDLGQIAFPNNVDNVIVITSPTDPILLGTVTAPAVPTSASGNVLTNDSFGADGGRILSILVDGVTHTWDGTDANKVLSVTTALGGSLTFNFSTGDWEYDAPAQLSSNTPETFTYTLVDGDGDTTTANLVVNIQAVNDAPENVVPSSLTAAEDIELSITNVIVSDADAGNGDLTVKLEVKKGTLTLATEDDLVVSNNGSDTVTLTGSLTAINAALLGMKYKGDLNFNGSDELKITTTDNGNTGIGGAKTDVDTVAITVTPVNDAPTATDDVLSAVSEDSIVRTISFASLLGNDSRGPSNESTQSLTITELSNVVGGTAEIRGTNILFTPAANFNGVASFDYTVRDNGQTNGLNDFKTDVGSVSFSVTPVNDAPVNTVPSSLTAVEDTELAITGVSISDVDAGGSNMTVKLEVKDGTLTLASTQGVTAVSSSGGATLTLTGTVTAINTALAGLKYKGDLNFNGSDQLKITTTDNGNTGAGGPKSDVDTVNITVTPVPDTATVSGKQNVDMRSYDKVVYNNASHDPQGDTAAIVSNFDVANHKIAITVGSPAVSVTGGTFVTVSSLSDIYAAGSVIEILRETNSSANDGDNAAIEQLIYRSIDDVPQGFYTVIVYGSTRSNADAYVFTMKVNSTQSGGQTLDTDEFSIEHVMTLQSVGYGSLRASNFVAAADPIILDLDRNGFAFSSIDNGVTFDINADGKSDQIAWTSDDGILAYDVDGNGLIDNGSEIFTPDFNGGKFASGVAALASLDSNSDGKIDANDDAFSKLKIWVDANNNGISDEGELSSLFDNGVTSISLTTDNTGGQEDGQTVFSTGTFTFADGSTGDFMEVGFDTIFGSDADPLTVMGTDGDDILHGGMGQVVMTGGAGNDTFVFDGTALDELDVADVITDFNGDGDVLDVTALLDSLLGEQASAETAASHLRATVDDGNTTVSVQTGADTWKDVVVLQNHDTAIKVLFDDKHAVVTPHD